jgi:hypothetical protein
MESFFTESGFYLVAAGFVQSLGALLIAPFFFPVARRLSGASFPTLLRAYLIFNAFLLFWGCFGHYLFHSVTFGRLYVSADRVVDWFPFIPFGQWALDQTLGPQRGHLIGTSTLWQLRLIWLAVAAPVWLLTYASTVFVLRLRFPRFPSFTRPAGRCARGR